ncbi:BRCA2, oligonucleotide/oligosaccharide-binding, domain 1-domain-containing protein [Melampsora americana]|nr:BRCA2, oligonucleotide/oligosaccharide-binding, domain 1-domain-containing protein [Melampsora americana]
MSQDSILLNPRPLKRICLSSPINPSLNSSQSDTLPIEPPLPPSGSSPALSIPVRRNGASHPMIPSTKLRITSCPCLAIPTGQPEGFENEHTELNSSSKSSSQNKQVQTRTSHQPSPHSGPLDVEPSSAQGLASVSGMISEPLEDFDGDLEDWDEMNDWKDYEQADIEILDEVEAQNLQLGKSDEGDIFYSPPSNSKIASLNLAPIPISRDPPQSSGHNSSRAGSSPTRSVRATLDPPTRTTSLFTTGHQQPIIFRNAGSSSFGNVLPFRAPSKIGNHTIISSDHHPPEPRTTEDVPLLGFTTGHGRTVTPPSKQAVQNALDGLTSADFMSSSPDRSEHLPDSPTPHTRALNGPPVSTSPKRLGPKDNVQYDCNKDVDHHVPTKLSFVDEENSNLEGQSPTKIRMNDLNTDANALIPFDCPNVRTSNMSRRSISSRKSVIDIAPFFASGRLSIARWLGPPKSYTPRQLYTLGVPESIVFMTAKAAKLWHFNPLSDEPFGPLQALGELYKSGCLPSKATPEWLALNWELIIWKFSGMIRWLPSCRSRLWKPTSIVQQLKYRYEREFNYGHRSAVRLMLDNECPLGAPVCLFVSSIKSSRNFLDGKAKWNANDSMTDCKLELSDGWYKINCVIDATIFRSISNGRIKVGYKLAIGGALLRSSSLNKSNQSKVDESSVDEPELMLEGNSTSRARWSESLGFRNRPWFASLRSLTSDGGRVSMMDIVILRMFPSMFIDENNPHDRWGEEEEIEHQAAWETSRQTEVEQILQERNEEYQKLIKTRDLIDDTLSNRLEGNHSPKKNETNSNLPSIDFDVDDVLEGLLDGTGNLLQLKKLTINELRELLDGIKSMVEQFERSAPDEVQKTLDERVPLRKIREVCTLRIQDYQNFKYVSNQRTAQLLIQDLTKVEEGLLREGERYWVQNVQPQKNIRWDARLERVELLLCTRRDTKWRMIKEE